MPSMRKSGSIPGIKTSPMVLMPQGSVSPAAPDVERGLLVFLALSHDFGGVEVDAAGREGVADKEVVGEIRIVVLAGLEVGVLDDGERQLDRLRHDLALER